LVITFQILIIAGAAVGTAITYPLGGLIILYLNWEWVFYGTGVITLAWSMAWWLYAFDAPSKHPRITDDEKEYLQEQIGDLVNKKVR